MKASHSIGWLCSTALTIIMVIVCVSEAVAGGKIGIYGNCMEPSGQDAEHYSKAGYGVGLHVVIPVPQLANCFAATAGLETVNLLNDTVTFRDKRTGLRVDQETNQSYCRLFAGGQVGTHGRGFIRPHAGLNLALVYYSISTDVVVPDDYDREKEIRQNLRKESHFVFGYDITLGVDLNFANKWNIDGGVRYLKTFGLPQQLYFPPHAFARDAEVRITELSDSEVFHTLADGTVKRFGEIRKSSLCVPPHV